jgi:glycosyltransferase involved in cell wall biosynthesis
LFSSSEGFGIPILEAARCGTVSLTSEVTSMVEFISPNRKPKKCLASYEITERIDLFLFNEDYRIICESDREYVVNKFTKENQKKLLKVFFDKFITS